MCGSKPGIFDEKSVEILHAGKIQQLADFLDGQCGGGQEKFGFFYLDHLDVFVQIFTGGTIEKSVQLLDTQRTVAGYLVAGKPFVFIVFDVEHG